MPVSDTEGKRIAALDAQHLTEEFNAATAARQVIEARIRQIDRDYEEKEQVLRHEWYNTLKPIREELDRAVDYWCRLYYYEKVVGRKEVI